METVDSVMPWVASVPDHMHHPVGSFAHGTSCTAIFFTIARKQSISAANAAHLSQPILSRQLKKMEEELGKTLFLRGNRKIILTEESMLLRKRAQEVMKLLEKAQEEIACSTEIIAGNIHIGIEETEGICPLIQSAHALQKQYPLVHFHIVNGDKTTVLKELDHGLISSALP